MNIRQKCHFVDEKSLALAQTININTFSTHSYSVVDPLTPTTAIWEAIKHPVPDRVKPSFVSLTSGHYEHQGVRMSKITNNGLTRSGTGCRIAVPIWQQWASNL